LYLKELWRFIRPAEYSRAEGRRGRAYESVVNSSVALGFANLTVKRNPHEEAVYRAGRTKGGHPAGFEEAIRRFRRSGRIKSAGSFGGTERAGVDEVG